MKSKGTYVKVLVLLLALISCSLLDTVAQVAEVIIHPIVAGINVGAGYGSLHGPALGITLDASTPYGLLSLRAVSVSEPWDLTVSPIEENYDLSLLYGAEVNRMLDQLLRISVSAGVSRTTIVRRGAYADDFKCLMGCEYETIRKSQIGFAHEVRLTIGRRRGTRLRGASLSWFGNQTKGESYHGVLLTLYFGQRFRMAHNTALKRTHRRATFKLIRNTIGR